MKTTFKTFILSLTAAVSMSIAVFSCKKDSASTDTTVSEADAIELATNAVASSSGGFSTQVTSSVSAYKALPLSCGVQKDSTITGGSTGSLISYNYTLKWSYLETCANLLPGSLTLNFSGTTTYDTPRMSSNDKSTAIFILTGLPLTTPAYTINSNYVRNGSQTSKIGRNNGFTSMLTMASTNIMVDKTTMQIVSGTSTISMTGSSTAGKAFSYGGTITFLGGGKATVTLNSGVSYPIQW